MPHAGAATLGLRQVTTAHSTSHRGNVVRLLIDYDVDVEALHEMGRTLVLLPCGPRVLDVVQALSQAGGNIYAKSYDGRNAADRAHGSSGTVRG